MTDILIEQLGAVSMRNGLVRIQTQASGANGEDRVTGEIVIPASQYGQVVGALQNAGEQLQAKLQQAREAQQSSEG